MFRINFVEGMMEAGEDKPGPARRPKSEATREKILTTALSLFAEKGFAETTMREIAAQADCSLGLAYRYFTSKDQMALALYERLVEEFAEEVAALPSGTPLAFRWARATRGDFARLQPHRGTLTGLMSAGLLPGSRTQVLGDAAAPLRRRMVAIFDCVVTDAKDAPRDAVTGDALATLFYGLHLLLVFFWLQDPTPNQRATGQLIETAEQMMGRLRLLLRVPGVAETLRRLGGILSPLLKD